MNPPAGTNAQQTLPSPRKVGGAGAESHTAPADNAASHRAKILAHLRAGWTLTHMDAQNRFGCARLAARVYELRKDGHVIDTDMVETDGGAHVARYRLVKA